MSMFPIVVVSNEKMVKQLAEILSSFFTISVVTEDEIKVDVNCEILIIKANDLKGLKLNRGVLILSDSCETTLEKCVCPIIIADGNRAFLHERIDTETQYITCGMSAKDTISFSSIDIDEVSVSLMREVKRINGEIVEPFEISVCSKNNISNYSPFCILSAVALITVLGAKINDLKLCLE